MGKKESRSDRKSAKLKAEVPRYDQLVLIVDVQNKDDMPAALEALAEILANADAENLPTWKTNQGELRCNVKSVAASMDAMTQALRNVADSNSSNANTQGACVEENQGA